jgi:hypothetical protein
VRIRWKCLAGDGETDSAIQAELEVLRTVAKYFVKVIEDVNLDERARLSCAASAQSSADFDARIGKATLWERFLEVAYIDHAVQLCGFKKYIRV